MTARNRATNQQTLFNLSSIWINRVVLILIPLISTPLITNTFGLEVAGIWFLASIFGYQLLLLEIGISTSLVRLLAKKNIFMSKEKSFKIISTAFFSLTFVSFFLIFGIEKITQYFILAFDIPDVAISDTKVLIYIIVISIAINLPCRIGYSIFSSRHRFDIVQVIDTIGQVLKLISIIALFKLANPTIFLLGAIVFGISSLISVILFIYSLKFYSFDFSNITFKNFSIKYLKKILSLSGAAFIITLSSMILLQLSSFLVGIYISPKYVPLIAIPIMILNSITPFFQAFSTITGPIAAGVSNLSEKKELYENFKYFSLYSTSLCLFSLVTLLIVGRPLLEIWLLGDQVSVNDIETIYKVLLILLGAFSLSFSSALGKSVLVSVGNHWKSALIDLFTSVLSILTGVFLMIYTDLGLMGMIIGMGICYLTRGIFIYPSLLSKYFNVSVLNFFRMSIIAPVILYAILILFIKIVHSFLSDNYGNIEILAMYLFFSILIIILNYMFIIKKEHKLKIANFFKF